MTLPTADDFTAVTTRAKQRRHWALTAELHTSTDEFGGRRGATLCNAVHGGIDQLRLDMQMPPAWRKRYVIAELKPCKVCDASKARRIAGRPS